MQTQKFIRNNQTIDAWLFDEAVLRSLQTHERPHCIWVKGPEEDGGDETFFVTTVNGNDIPVGDGDWIVPEPDTDVQAYAYAITPDQMIKLYSPLVFYGGDEVTGLIEDGGPIVERLFTADQIGPGGAFHHYRLTWQQTHDFRKPDDADFNPTGVLDVHFQNGPIQEAGVNGVTQEALIGVAIHRLRCFEAGEFACAENAAALGHLEQALVYLNARTADRRRRGVEGQNEV